MLTALDDYNWSEVFGEGDGGNCTAIQPRTSPGYVGSAETFSREDVAEIRGMEEGERDERDWIVWGQLKDGRWFIARGGCDYTGWDCRASNSGDVDSTQERLIRFGMSDDERSRFNLSITAATEQADAGKGSKGNELRGLQNAAESRAGHCG